MSRQSVYARIKKYREKEAIEEFEQKAFELEDTEDCTQ
jgi:hypothetical protein